MASKKIRLFKIASEINLGKDALVEYLQNKGFEIENKPTSVLSEEMVESVYGKFKREKKAAEVAREKVQKQKDIRKQKNEAAKDEAIEKIVKLKPSSIDKSKILDSLFADFDEDEDEIAEPTIIELEKPKEPVKVQEVIPEPKEAPKSEAKASLNSEIENPINSTDDSADKAKQAKKIETDTKDTAPKDKSSDVTVAKPAPKELSAEPKSELKSEDKSSEKKSDKKTERKQEKTDDKNKSKKNDKPDGKSDEKKNTNQDKTKSEQEPSKEKSTKTRRGREFADPDNKPELKGLKVMGKINLKVEEAKPSFKKRKRNKGDKGKPDNRGKSQDRSGQKGQAKTGDRPARTGDRTDRPARPGDRPARPGDRRTGSDRGTARPNDRSTDRNSDRKKGDRNATGRPPRSNDPNDKAVVMPDSETGGRRRKKRTTEINIDQVASSQNNNKKRGKRKKSIREQIKQEDVDKALKRTLAGMADGKASSRAKIKQKRKEQREAKEEVIKEEQEREDKILELTEYVTTSDLANLMDISTNEIILECMGLGLMVTINQRLDKDTIQLIADDYGYEISFLDEEETVTIEDEEDSEESLKPRPPIVTIMGHVDHGKTSLLDYIRKEKVVAGEAGGITQHMGAYMVNVKDGKSITFLDTPGHEAFTAMRARGAQVTDLVILVVAADDAVMPQTLEAISHAQAAEVPIVVAINKMDKPAANADKIKQELSEHDILVESWGGKYQSVEISAKTGLNVDSLLETILLESEMLDLKANPDRKARGTVIEAHMEKGLGPVATIIVEKGTMNIGDPFVAGAAHGKIRVLFDERSQKLKNATPAHPVRVIGLDTLPSVGDAYITVETESQAKVVANERAKLKREQELRQIRHVTLDDISADIAIGGVKDLFIVLKGDVMGSVEALSDSLQKLSTPEVKVVMLHKGVGDINENDINLAVASKAVVIGFNTTPTVQAKKLADRENIEVRNYSIIYDCINDVEDALEGMLSPEISVNITGEAEVRKIFKIGRTQKIAGCRVTSGKIGRNDKAKVLRDGLPIFEGKIGSLRREKDEAKSVSEGYECGITIDGFSDLREDDIIQTLTVTQTARKLKRS